MFDPLAIEEGPEMLVSELAGFCRISLNADTALFGSIASWFNAVADVDTAWTRSEASTDMK